MITIIAIVMLGLAYRLRGGGFVALPSTLLARLVWCAALGVAYLLIVGVDIGAAWVAVGGFLSMLVPHAYCQNMGRWPEPQNRWPSFFMPPFTQQDWDNTPATQRTIVDATNMLYVGAWRGLIVFMPLCMFGTFFMNAWVAMTVIAFAHPLSYLSGWSVPFSAGKSLPAHSTDWAELFVGLSWGVGLIVLAW